MKDASAYSKRSIATENPDDQIKHQKNMPTEALYTVGGLNIAQLT